MMDIWLDFMDIHNHTVWSDGINSSKAIVENAIKHNIKVIGITDHFNTNKCNSIKPEDIDCYINEIRYVKNLYADQIKVYAGIEICCIPFPESLKSLPVDKLNKLDFLLLEYMDKLSPSIKLEDIEGYIKKVKCKIGLAHTDLFRLAKNYFDQGGLDFILGFLSNNNIFWEINANPVYDIFDDIIYNNDGEHIQNLFRKLKEKGIKVSVGSDNHSIYNFQYSRLQQANKIMKILNEHHGKDID